MRMDRAVKQENLSFGSQHGFGASRFDARHTRHNRPPLIQVTGFVILAQMVINIFAIAHGFYYDLATYSFSEQMLYKRNAAMIVNTC